MMVSRQKHMTLGNKLCPPMWKSDTKTSL